MTADQTGATLRRNIERLRRLTAQTMVADVPPPEWPQSLSARRGLSAAVPVSDVPRPLTQNGMTTNEPPPRSPAVSMVAAPEAAPALHDTPSRTPAPAPEADAVASNGVHTDESAQSGSTTTVEVGTAPASLSMPVAPRKQPLLLPAPAWPRPRGETGTRHASNGITPLSRDGRPRQPIAFRTNPNAAPSNGNASSTAGSNGSVAPIEDEPTAGDGTSPDEPIAGANGTSNGTRNAAASASRVHTPERCSALRTSGEPCGASPVPGYDTCIGHGAWNRKSPEARRRRPSRARDNEQLTPARLLETLNRLEWALREVLDGDLDPQRARAVAAVGDALGRVVEVGLVERRLADLEARMDRLPE